MTSQKLAFWDFWRTADNVLNTGKPVAPPLFNDPEMLPSASNKAKLFPKTLILKTQLSLCPLPLLELHNITVTPEMVKKVITKLASSKTSSPDCICVVVLNNCEPTLSYQVAQLFKKCLAFQIAGRSHRWSLYLRKNGERCAPNNYHPLISFLPVDSKIFERLVNNRIVDHLEKCGLFSDFQYSFRSSRSTTDLMTVASHRIARAFNRCGAA